MPPETCRVDLQRNKTSLHVVTSVGYSIEYYDARNNKYQESSCALFSSEIMKLLLSGETLKLSVIYNAVLGLDISRFCAVLFYGAQTSRILGQYAILQSSVSQMFLLVDPLLASQNNHGSSLPCLGQY